MDSFLEDIQPLKPEPGLEAKSPILGPTPFPLHRILGHKTWRGYFGGMLIGNDLVLVYVIK